MQALHDINDVFSIWGDKPIAPMARDIGENYDTVRKWRDNKRIPETSWSSIIQAAVLRDRVVTADDLLRLNAPTPRQSQKRAAG